LARKEMAVRRAPLGKGTAIVVLALILGIVDVVLNAADRYVSVIRHN
jgi:hypothetical protein